MKFLLTAMLLSFSLTSYAETITATVYTADPQDGFLRLSNGRVVFMDQSLKSMQTIAPGARVRIEVGAENTVAEVEVMGPPIQEKSLNLLEGERPVYIPSVLANFEAVKAMFDRLNPNYMPVSECTDRAHVWSYDEFKSNGIMSQKVFIFFTKSYIDRHHFKWWFHVSPLVKVQEGAAVVPRVLDFRYTDGPRTIKEWSDLQVFSKRDCKMIMKLSEYHVNPQTEDCYMVIESMYYRLPEDLDAQELKQQYRTQFFESEVKFSRKMAFEKQTTGNNP
jgi:hypothetical protein